ncbi:MAG: hypothetical protein KAQ85_04685 [Thermodesulfovibrionia bacterium]|nr:hypothetical protein [Thermodesulfovibrionia bacterium]
MSIQKLLKQRPERLKKGLIIVFLIASLMVAVFAIMPTGEFSIISKEEAGVKITITVDESKNPVYEVSGDTFYFNTWYRYLYFDILIEVIDGSSFASYSLVYDGHSAVSYPPLTVWQGSMGNIREKNTYITNIEGTHTLIVNARTTGTNADVSKVFYVEDEGWVPNSEPTTTTTIPTTTTTVPTTTIEETTTEEPEFITIVENGTTVVITKTKPSIAIGFELFTITISFISIVIVMRYKKRSAKYRDKN